MLRTVAWRPCAPLLLAAVSPQLPATHVALRDEADAVVAATADADVTVLLAAGSRSVVYTAAHADLAGLGRPDLTASREGDPERVAAFASSLGLPLASAALPLDLAVLALTTAPQQSVVAVEVDAQADPATLATLGARLVAAAADADTAVLAAADGSAALTEKAPRHLHPHAADWQAAYAAALGAGDVAALAALGPHAAAEVAARGWACTLVALHAATQAGLPPEVRTATAPRGVGYVIAVAPARAAA